MSDLDTKTETIDATAEPETAIDKATGTTAAEREEIVAKAQETLSKAFENAVEAVKQNPKTAAAIAAGVAAAVAGAAYGATKLAGAAPRTRRSPARRAPAKPAAKK